MFLADRFPKASDMEAFYDHYTEAVADAKGEAHTSADELARAQRIADSFIFESVERHLDVGCARGHLLRLVREKYGCESNGVDLRKFDTVPHWTKYIEDVTDTYDLVTVIHTLEHHPFPIEFLREIREKCSKNLFIEVPSPGMEGIFRTPHPVLFTAVTLPEVVEKCGFLVTSVRQVFNSGKIELQCEARAI
jgi:2-polyprenyl-3-methyl-5-hydroxy-6-metoxy-1,4-benzoquinol methylase